MDYIVGVKNVLKLQKKNGMAKMQSLKKIKQCNIIMQIMRKTKRK